MKSKEAAQLSHASGNVWVAVRISLRDHQITLH